MSTQEFIICPYCTNARNILVARDGKSTRKCSNCFNVWLPVNDKKEITITDYNCVECGKQIWGFTKVEYRKGTEQPPLIHGVCLERLKTFENSIMQTATWALED